jgi:hypothetical protein
METIAARDTETATDLDRIQIKYMVTCMAHDHEEILARCKRMGLSTSTADRGHGYVFLEALAMVAPGEMNVVLGQIRLALKSETRNVEVYAEDNSAD